MTLSRAFFLRLLLIHASTQFIALQFPYEVELKVFSGFDGKLLASLKQVGDALNRHLVIEFPQKSKQLVLDVYLKDDFKNDIDDTTDIVEELYRNCDGTEPRHYNGKIRGRDESVAELVICEGITGFIRDNDKMIRFMSVQQKNKVVNFNEKQLTDKSDFSIVVHYSEDVMPLRKKRETEPPSPRPYPVYNDSRYIQLALVIDNDLVEALEKSEDKIGIYKRYQNITNHVNALFQEFHVFVALVAIEFWNCEQKSNAKKHRLTSNILDCITHHVNVEMKDKNFDSAILVVKFNNTEHPKSRFLDRYSSKICDNLTKAHGIVFDDGVRDYKMDDVIKAIANVLGRNLGIENDVTARCNCSDDNLCIMRTTDHSEKSLKSGKLGWSNCSKDAFIDLSNENNWQCINDPPTKLFSIPSCGNSFIEADEDCDVGLLNADEDENKCCDSKHCKYRIDECRPVKHECDLPEICPGNSKKCPKDVVKSGTERCVGITKCKSNSTCDTPVAHCTNNCSGNGFCDNYGECHWYRKYNSSVVQNTSTESPVIPDAASTFNLNALDELLTVRNILVIILLVLLLFCVYHIIKKSSCEKSHQSQNDLAEFWSRDNPSLGRAQSETPPGLNTSRVADFSHNSRHSDYPFAASDEPRSSGNRQQRGNDSLLNYATLARADRDPASYNVPKPNHTVYATFSRSHELDAPSMSNFANLVLIDNNSDLNPTKESNRNLNLLD